MNLEKYFAEKKGIGVMATSSADGEVDTAIYARPHVQGKNNVAFIMRDRLTHKNLLENVQANYLFIEDGPGYRGMRMFLTKESETSDEEEIAALSRRSMSPGDERLQGGKFLVYFKVTKVLSLIGGEELEIE